MDPNIPFPKFLPSVFTKEDGERLRKQVSDHITECHHLLAMLQQGGTKEEMQDFIKHDLTLSMVWNVLAELTPIGDTAKKKPKPRRKK